MNERVKEVFHELADLPSEARARYFSEHPIDAETRKEVEEILAFDSGASAFLMRDVSMAASLSLPQLEPSGWRCGPYRLLDLIGRGGMGAVYRAERADGEVTQRLAVKLLPASAGDAQRERFLQERQILASLTHPNIARMLDAGHVENGQPFLAMEYVEGKPIDEFGKGLNPRQKIALFLKVCAAVAYLHRNLVVHRDLKPSNILVTAEGEPKLLDFGIAKMLDVSTDSTVTSMRMLTPNYASPEQVTGGRITTATDIYSLGAVLYGLLTGKNAHEFGDHSPEGIVQAVVTREVTRPAKWAPELKGDLESILLKALRKDPQERYATVEQFADDLQAFLESRTVRARSGNTWYRARKFLRRYWVPLTAAGLVITSLAAGLYIANRERSTAERDRALAQRRFLEVRQLAAKLFDIDAQARLLPGSTKTRQLIVNTSLDYLSRLAKGVQGDPDLAVEVGTAYMRVARVQGVPTASNLGQMDEAEKNLRIAEPFIDSALRAQPANRTALLRSAQIAHDRMILARLSGRSEETLPLARKAAAALEKFHAGPGDKPEASPILNTYLNVADQFELEQHLEEALQLCVRGPELARATGRLDYLGDFLWVKAKVLRDRADLQGALQTVQESVDLLEKSTDRREILMLNVAQALMFKGRILGEDHAVSLGRSAEAVEALSKAFQIADEMAHRDEADQGSRGKLAMAGISLADILRHSDARRALEVYDHTFRHLGEVRNNASFQRYEVNVLAGSSYVLRSLGRLGEARQRLDAAFAHLRQLNLYPADQIKPGSEADETLRALADYEADTGNVSRALQIYQELLDHLGAGGAKPDTMLSDAVDLSNAYRSMVALYRRTGRVELASSMEAKRLAMWRQWDQQFPNNPFVLGQIAAKDAL